MSLEYSLLRDREACKILGCSRSTLWRRVQDGTLPSPVKIGNISRFVASEIFEAIELAKEQRCSKMKVVAVLAYEEE